MDGNFVLMDIAAAQWAFDRLGRVDRVDLRLADPARLDEAERVIASRLPAGLAVQRPARRGSQVERMLASFQFNLAALSWVAVLVGLFLVHNTVSTSVIARREEIGMLRALGVARRTVLTLFLGEALALGVAGCAMGIAVGWGLAHAAVGFTASTVTTLYVAEAAGVPALSWIEVVGPLRLASCWRWPLQHHLPGKRAGSRRSTRFARRHESRSARPRRAAGARSRPCALRVVSWRRGRRRSRACPSSGSSLRCWSFLARSLSCQTRSPC
jgi:putative ABC transport system permease protein